ncbi:MAG: hypothetical protein WAR57_15320 [Candidatus Phosphoribacter sp.]
MKWALEIDCLTINAGMRDNSGSGCQVASCPGSPRRVVSLLRGVEEQDPQVARGQRGASTQSWAVERVRIVRDEQDSEPVMLATGVIDHTQRWGGATRADHTLHRLGQGPDLRIAVAGLPDRLPVDAEGHVVQEEPTVHLTHVDHAFHALSERVQCPDHVLPVHTQVQGEVVACTGRDADERQPMRRGDCRYVCERPVSTSDTDGVRTVGDDLQRARPQVVAGAQRDRLDSAPAGLLEHPAAGRRTVTGPGVDE